MIICSAYGFDPYSFSTLVVHHLCQGRFGVADKRPESSVEAPLRLDWMWGCHPYEQSRPTRAMHYQRLTPIKLISPGYRSPNRSAMIGAYQNSRHTVFPIYHSSAEHHISLGFDTLTLLWSAPCSSKFFFHSV